MTADDYAHRIRMELVEVVHRHLGHLNATMLNEVVGLENIQKIALDSFLLGVRWQEMVEVAEDEELNDEE